MKVATSKLSCKALDYLVAQIEGVELIESEAGQTYLYSKAFGNLYSPSRAEAGGWNITGPIIHREGIALELFKDRPGDWSAFIASGYLERGRSPLIAALRAFVAMKLGDTVEVPGVLFAVNPAEVEAVCHAIKGRSS